MCLGIITKNMSQASPQQIPEGIVTSADSPSYVNLISKNAIPLGTLLNLCGQLGMVVESLSKSQSISKSRSYEEANEAKQIPIINTRDLQFQSKIQILGDITSLENSIIDRAHTVITPGTVATTPTTESLKNIFAPEHRNWSPIGELLHTGSPLSINISGLAKHIGIFGKTGSGKSSTEINLLNSVASKNGTAIVFDLHGEMKHAKIPNSNLLEGKLDPKFLDNDALADIIEIRSGSTIQRTVLTQSLTDHVKNSRHFWESLLLEVRTHLEEKGHKSAAERVIEMIELIQIKQAKLFQPIGNPIYSIIPGKINLIDLSELTAKQADLVVSEYLKKIDTDRRRACNPDGNPNYRVQFKIPVFIMIDEVHNFIPLDDSTRSKFWIKKVARESRKFGVSLGITTQRIRNCDPTVISQLGSMIIHTTTHADDKSVLHSSSEHITSEMLPRISELGCGQVLMLGDVVRIPVYGKVTFYENKYSSDHDLVAEWAKASQT